MEISQLTPNNIKIYVHLDYQEKVETFQEILQAKLTSLTNKRPQNLSSEVKLNFDYTSVFI